jgi:hypothetical protein
VPGLAVSGVALVGIVAGAAFFGASSAKRSSAGAESAQILASHGACVANAPNYDTRCPALASALRADDALHNAGVGAMVIGSMAAVGAAAYFLLPIPPRAPVVGRRVRVTPIVGAREGGLSLVGSF